jgi:uncharacterized protein YbjT (DUF2867 family)
MSVLVIGGAGQTGSLVVSQLQTSVSQDSLTLC